jgi:hypothetical protein
VVAYGDALNTDRECKSVRRDYSAFLGCAVHCNDSPIVADFTARRSIAVVVATFVCSDDRDDRDFVDRRVPQMAEGKLRHHQKAASVGGLFHFPLRLQPDLDHAAASPS